MYRENIDEIRGKEGENYSIETAELDIVFILNELFSRFPIIGCIEEVHCFIIQTQYREIYT